MQFPAKLLVTLALSASIASAASADAPVIALHYQAPASCPPAETLQDLVRVRLGHAPFEESARSVLTVSVEEPGADWEYVAQLRWQLEGGATGQRELRDARCDALMETVAVSVSLAVEEVEALAEDRALARDSDITPESALAPDTDRAVDAAPEPAPAESMPEGRSGASETSELRAQVGVAAGAGFGPAPGAYPTFVVDAALGLGAFELHLALTYSDTFGARDVAYDAGLRTSLLRARVAVCWVPAPVTLCLAGSAGMMEGSARSVAQPVTGRAPVGTAGVVLGATHWLDDHVGLSVQSELAAFFPNLSFDAGASSLWSTRPVLAEVAGGLVGRW